MVKRKVLDANHTLIFTSHFPYAIASQGKKQAILGIGGNIGDVLRRFEHLFWYFKRSKFLNIIETSPILKNPPFGFTEQKDFFNAVIRIETTLQPRQLLHYVLHVEKLFGRKRSFPDAPRTLDIDILFYENVTIESKNLTIPHPEWIKRSSVLIPLSYMKANERAT